MDKKYDKCWTDLFSTTDPKIFLLADDNQSIRFSYNLTCAPSCFWYSKSCVMSTWMFFIDPSCHTNWAIARCGVKEKWWNEIKWTEYSIQHGYLLREIAFDKLRHHRLRRGYMHFFYFMLISNKIWIFIVAFFISSFLLCAVAQYYAMYSRREIMLRIKIVLLAFDLSVSL